MPMPVKSNCSTRSMEALGGRSQATNCMLNANRPPQHWRGPIGRSIVEVNMLVVDDGALLVPDDVVAVQPVAILVEIIFALRAGIFLDRQNSLADFRRLRGTGLVDRHGQDGDCVIGPGALVVGR